MGWRTVIGAYDQGPERDFAGTNLYDDQGRLRAFCSPFDHSQPLTECADAINRLDLTESDAIELLKQHPRMYVCR